MSEEQMRAICLEIQSEWQIGGLCGSMYEDFAVELAKRVQAVEQERIADELESRGFSDAARSLRGFPA